MTPQENLDRISALRKECLEHPMCLQLIEETGSTQVRVIYPDGDFKGIGGVQTTQKSKAASFEVVLEEMEKAWLGSYPSPIETAPWLEKETDR